MEQKLAAVAHRAAPRDLSDMYLTVMANWQSMLRSRSMYLTHSFLEDHVGVAWITLYASRWSIGQNNSRIASDQLINHRVWRESERWLLAESRNGNYLLLEQHRRNNRSGRSSSRVTGGHWPPSQARRIELAQRP